MSNRFSSLRTGPKLARRLAAVDVAALPDEQLLDYAKAEFRQLAQQQARAWAAFAEIGRRAPLNFDHDEQWTPDRIFDSAVCELVAELRVSKPYAAHELAHAQDLEQLPAVAAALRAGELDRNRVLVLLDVCSDLSAEHRDKLLAEVLPEAGTLPAGTLRTRAQRLAIALDPGWAERRYRQAVRERKVVRYVNRDGTVTIAAEDQPAEEALAADARLTALAKSAQRAGAHATLNVLRSELAMGLLTPRFTGLREPEMIAYLVAQFPEAGDEPTGDAPEPSQPTPTEPAAPSEREAVTPFGIELRVGLATLMGLTEQPGEVAGAGAVVASVARTIAEQQRRAEWRFAIVDGQGELLHGGITRHRPTGYARGGEKGGIVELHVPTYLLDPAFIEEHPAWAKLLTGLAGQYEQPAPIEQDPAARFPRRPLRRRVQLRQRFCVFPGCRRPAADSQVDHRHDHARGGVTLEGNLGPLCDRHHQLKTRWGWRLIKRDDSTYVWISPLGRRHLVKIEPVAPPLPDPPDTSAA